MEELPEEIEGLTQLAKLYWEKTELPAEIKHLKNFQADELADHAKVSEAHKTKGKRPRAWSQANLRAFP